ncbi:hypothetical protein, partial [Variovorax sp. LjRoot178]|uniref:hypothetical protein n=1 Tax=Variovorax sp. LjRoot178 TaxID=3342277 RepID=UPI003F50F192
QAAHADTAMPMNAATRRRRKRVPVAGMNGAKHGAAGAVPSGERRTCRAKFMAPMIDAEFGEIWELLRTAGVGPRQQRSKADGADLRIPQCLRS